MTEPVGPLFFDHATRAGLDLVAVAGAFAEFASDTDGDAPAHRLERGEISLEAYFDLLGPVGPAARQLLDPRSEWFVPAHFVAHQGMHRLAREVAARGYRTALVTNSVAEWLPWWSRIVPEADIFDAVIHSCEVGLRKPDPAMFSHAMGVLGLEAAETLFLDDFSANVAAGERAGLVTVHVVDHDRAIEQVHRLLGE